MLINKRKSVLLTLSILMSISASTYANEAVANKEVVRTPEVVVTATRTEQEVKVIPNAVEVITSKDIEELGATDIYSALRLATNVDVSSSGAGHRLMVRGKNAGALVLLDGRRVSNEYSSMTRGAFDLDKINLSSIERIEIIRGAASAQYGADAESGVINIITKKSQDQSVTIGVNTSTDVMNNYYRFDLGQQGKFSGILNANFAKYRKRDFVNGTGTNYFGPRTNYDFNGTYEFDDKNSIDLYIGYYDEKSRKITDYSSMGMPGKSTTNYDKTVQDYSLTYNGKGDNSNYMIRTYYNRYDKEEYKSSKNVSYKNNIFDTLGIEAKNTVQAGENHLLTYGTEYKKIGVEGPILSLGEGNSKDNSSYAGYLQDEWFVNEKFLVIPAIRYDHDEEFGGKTTPKIGATYFISDNSRIKANWGKSWRAPNLVELYSGQDHGFAMIYGNPDLKPEEATTWELGFEAEKNNNWFKLNYFNSKYDNLITYDEVNGVNTFINEADAKTDGIEFEVGRQFNDNWSIRATSNWLDAKDSNDNSISATADNITTLELNYDDNNRNGYNAKLWNSWVSNYHYSNEDYNYNTLNLVVNKKFTFDDGRYGRVYAGVDNIGDKKIGDIYLEGRIWRVGAEITF